MTCSFEEDSIHNKHFCAKMNVEKQASIMSFHNDSNPPRTRCDSAGATDSICLAFLQTIGQLFSFSSMRFGYLTSRVADNSCICK